MDVWVEVIDSSYREGGQHAVEISEPAFICIAITLCR